MPSTTLPVWAPGGAVGFPGKSVLPGVQDVELGKGSFDLDACHLLRLAGKHPATQLNQALVDFEFDARQSLLAFRQLGKIVAELGSLGGFLRVLGRLPQVQTEAQASDG